jgi:hypothetical protein
MDSGTWRSRQWPCSDYVARALMPAECRQRMGSRRSPTLWPDGSWLVQNRGMQFCSWLDFAGKSARATFEPQPLIIFWPLYQTFSHRVLPDVVDRFLQTFIAPQNMIEGFVLPHGSGSPRLLVNAACSGSLDGTQDFRESEGPPCFIAQR